MSDSDRPRSPFAGLADFSTRPPVRVLSADEIEQTLAEHRLYLETEYHEGRGSRFFSRRRGSGGRSGGLERPVPSHGGPAVRITQLCRNPEATVQCNRTQLPCRRMPGFGEPRRVDPGDRPYLVVGGDHCLQGWRWLLIAVARSPCWRCSSFARCL